jgi:inosine-uridine nucleoside N-ribohydrolase
MAGSKGSRGAKGRGVVRLMRGLAGGACLLLLAGAAQAQPPAETAAQAAARITAPHNGRCILIDSDGDLDDYRAVAMLGLTGRIVAIVMTEGISRPVQGAGAMEKVLRRVQSILPTHPVIPVIPGASGNPASRGPLEPDFGKWRDNAERLNGLLPAPVAGSLPPPADLAAALRPHVKDCVRISLLVIGPWTSFLRYAAEVLERADRIIAQGRPYPDEAGGQPDGLNCIYDRDACLTAFDLLAGRQLRAGRRLRTEWVDIPNGLQSCGTAEPGVDDMGQRLYAFRPTLDWADALAKAKGLAPEVAEMLQKNHDGWVRTALWDDLAALYLLRPDVFGVRGGHLEPCVRADIIRGMLTTALEGRRP